MLGDALFVGVGGVGGCVVCRGWGCWDALFVGVGGGWDVLCVGVEGGWMCCL